MGTGSILIEKKRFDLNQFLPDLAIAAIRADLYFRLDEDKQVVIFDYCNERVFDYIFNRGGSRCQYPDFILKGRNFQLIVPKNIHDVRELLDYEHEELGLDPSLNLLDIAFIEEVRWGEKIYFRYIYEYLRINPHAYYWNMDYDWLFQWKDIKKYYHFPYLDSHWEYRNPKQLFDDPSFNEYVKADHDLITYINPCGNKIFWYKQRPKIVENHIHRFFHSHKRLEAKVADFVRKIKEVVGFQVKVNVDDSEESYYLHVVTKEEMIQVYSSLRAITDVEQFDKLIDEKHEYFLNPEKKRVILYIEKQWKNLRTTDQTKLENLRKKGITIVNSLEELKEVLR